MVSGIRGIEESSVYQPARDRRLLTPSRNGRSSPGPAGKDGACECAGMDSAGRKASFPDTSGEPDVSDIASWLRGRPAVTRACIIRLFRRTPLGVPGDRRAAPSRFLPLAVLISPSG
jgi:hypothetical protein